MIHFTIAPILQTNIVDKDRNFTTDSQRKPFEGIHYNAYVKNENGTATDEIEISKNGGPFAMKASGNNSASYRIDF